MTGVLAETRRSLLGACKTCGHGHLSHRAPSLTNPSAWRSCSAAIPVHRDGSAPGPGEYTTGAGSVKFGSVCPCVRCTCPACQPTKEPQ